MKRADEVDMLLYDISAKAAEQGLENVLVSGITDDSRKLCEGNIFVCVSGNRVDGHDFAAEMLEKGASAVVVERDLGLKQQIVVDDSRACLSELASAWYGFPTKKLKLVAITGTNGKTTITEVVKHILRSLGKKTASIGTMGHDVGDKVYEAHNTTPEPMLLYRLFAEMVENGIEYCVMEASSQALVQRRIVAERFACACFTNLTQDHLDYHGTMENYYQAKKMLFSMCDSAVINVDDEYGKRLAAEVRCPVTTLSTQGMVDCYSENVKIKASGVSYWLMTSGERKAFPVFFGIPGYFNVANSMAAIIICHKLGFDTRDIIDSVETCKGVKGRCEVVYNGDFTVICDYAHTPDALEKILKTIKTFAEGRIICVFGAAGERDTKKRVPMGEIAARLADYLVVTTDNPRHEDPHKTVDDVIEGVRHFDTPYTSFVERQKAVYYALSIAREGDIVLLAGKGHETYQVIGDEYVDFDEHKIANDYFAHKG